MKDTIKFKAIGGLTFSEKPTIPNNKEESINHLLSLLGIISLLGGIFWDDIAHWFKKRIL